MTSEEPPGVSLRSLGLVAMDSLNCAEGGHHHIREESLKQAADRGGGEVFCEKCGQGVEVRAL